jgi:hypothetical protein
MEGLGVLLVVVAVFVANLPAAIEQWRTDRPGSIKTIWMFGVYCLYVGLGIVVLLLLAPKTGGQGGGDKAVTLTGFIVGFILYGGLTLMRVVPRYRDCRPGSCGSASPTSCCLAPRSPASPPISGHKSVAGRNVR